MSFSLMAFLIGVAVTTVIICLFGYFGVVIRDGKIASFSEDVVCAVAAIATTPLTIWFILSPVGKWLLVDLLLPNNPDSAPIYGAFIAGVITLSTAGAYCLVVGSLACSLQQVHRRKLRIKIDRMRQLNKLAHVQWTIPLYARVDLWDDRYAANNDTIQFLSARNLGRFHH